MKLIKDFKHVIRRKSAENTLFVAIFLFPLVCQNKVLFNYASIINLTCFRNSKIEDMTGKNRSLISPKVIRAWKMGSLNLTYLKSCDLARINPRAYSDGIIQEKNYSISSIPTQEPTEVLTHESLAAQEFSEMISRMRYSPQCEHQFIAKSKKELSRLGKAVKQTLSTNAASDLIRQNLNFEGACPGYIEMNSEQRRNLWVFVLMSMSHFESSCKSSATNQGPNGIAAGLMQLHHENENLYSKWDPDFNCEKGAAGNSKRSLQCALTMLNNQIYREQTFFSENSHWQVLRKSQKPGSQAFQIKYAISQIPDCKANPLYYVVDLKEVQQRMKEVRHSQSHTRQDIALR